MRRIALLLCLLSLAACQPSEPELAAPEFEKQAHVVQCLPALMALDTLADQAAGSQLGQRIPNAPWLRVDSELIDNRDSVVLNAQTLGPVIMPMLFKAQTALALEIEAISADDMETWVETFDIKQSPQRFMEYCTREAGFAQWRDAELTVPWLQRITLQTPPRNWLANMLSRSKSPEDAQPVVDQPVEMLRYGPRLGAVGTVALSADANGRQRVADNGEAVLLERYAPVWTIDKASGASLVSLTWDKQLAISHDAANYAYIDYGQLASTRLIRLNYISWWQDERDRITGLLMRMNISMRGKPIAVEIVNLDGSYYQLFAASGSAANALPDGVVLRETKLAAKMNVFVNASVSAAQRVLALSGGVTHTYGNLPFEALLGLSTPQGRQQSAFDKDGVLRIQQSYRKLLSWLTGVPKAGLPRNPATIFVDGDSLRFDDPKLLQAMGFERAAIADN